MYEINNILEQVYNMHIIRHIYHVLTVFQCRSSRSKL